MWPRSPSFAARRAPNGDWSASQTVGVNQYFIQRLRLAVAANGDAVLSWDGEIAVRFDSLLAIAPWQARRSPSGQGEPPEVLVGHPLCYPGREPVRPFADWGRLGLFEPHKDESS